MSNILLPDVEVFLRAECGGCKRFHDICCSPATLAGQCASWEYKHSGPECEVRYTKQKHKIPRGYDDTRFEESGKSPWFLDTKEFKENTNFQLAFNASAAITFTSLASLASDTNLLAGASSIVVDNGAGGTLLDVSITGAIKVGSSTLTASKEVDCYVWTKLDDSTYPDTISGSDATISITSAAVGNQFLSLITSIAPATTVNIVYPLRSYSLVNLLGNVRYWGVWVVQNTAQNLGSSGSSFTQKQSYVAG